MTYIQTVPEEGAPEPIAGMYAEVRAAQGHLPNFAQTFSLRPELFGAWLKLNTTIKSTMDLRRYELATVAAARRMRSSYCMLAHGSVLAERFVAPDELRAIVADHRAAGLDEVDVAVMDLAEKVADDAGSVTAADLDRLRAHGLSDAEIFDVIAASAARCFFTKILDATGTQPDARFHDTLEAPLREALTVGRPIADA